MILMMHLKMIIDDKTKLHYKFKKNSDGKLNFSRDESIEI